MPVTPDLVRAIAPTGTLRVAINLGNPVLTSGTSDAPGGVTVAIAQELGSRLGVPVALTCVDAARKSFAALAEGRVDVAFLAIEPARQGEVRFSPPYLTIEGVYVAAADSEFASASDVDRPGVRIGVKEGSAYDLYLSRTVTQAEIVRGADGIDIYESDSLDVAAGIRQPMATYVGSHGTHRILEPAFTQIRQAIGTPVAGSDEVGHYIDNLVQDLLRGGFIRSELERSGQNPDLANDA